MGNDVSPEEMAKVVKFLDENMAKKLEKEEIAKQKVYEEERKQLLDEIQTMVVD